MFLYSTVERTRFGRVVVGLDREDALVPVARLTEHMRRDLDMFSASQLADGLEYLGLIEIENEMDFLSVLR